MIKKIITGIVAVSVLSASSVLAEDSYKADSARGSMGNTPAHAELASLFKRSDAVYKDIALNSPKGAIPANALAKAKCIAVIPDVKTGAIGVGATIGDGLVSCRTSTGWSSPASVNLANVSLGAQLGGKVTDIVLLINSNKAESALKNGRFGIGVDASVAAGMYDAAATGMTDGVFAYQRSEGAYAGVSFSGGHLISDAEDNSALYGKNVTPSQILNGQLESNQSSWTDGFMKMLPS